MKSISRKERNIRIIVKKEAEKLAFKASEIERKKVFKSSLKPINIKRKIIQKAKLISGGYDKKFYKEIINSMKEKSIRAEIKIAQGKSWLAAEAVYRKTFRREFKKILNQEIQKIRNK